MQLAAIDLSDVYPRYERELAAFQVVARAVAREIFWEHLRQPSAAAWLADARPPRLFESRLRDYLIAVGDIAPDAAGRLQPCWPHAETATAAALIASYESEDPRRASLAYFLAACRDIAGGVLAGGDGLRLARARDLRGLMGRWEEVMLQAPILEPCRLFAARALAARLTAPTVVLEGGAGVGVVLRTLLQDPRLAAQCDRFATYYFTELDPGLLALGKARLARVAPPSLARALVYRQLDLDALAKDPASCGMAPASVDCVVLEHVLYDVADLHATLVALRSLLKPSGALIFTGAFRGPPARFFPCEMLQLTLASYQRAKLDPPYRAHIGYLSLAEWELSLSRAGFALSALPAKEDQERMPHGGIMALPR